MSHSADDARGEASTAEGIVPTMLTLPNINILDSPEAGDRSRSRDFGGAAERRFNLSDELGELSPPQASQAERHDIVAPPERDSEQLQIIENLKSSYEQLLSELYAERQEHHNELLKFQTEHRSQIERLTEVSLQQQTSVVVSANINVSNIETAARQQLELAAAATQERVSSLESHLAVSERQALETILREESSEYQAALTRQLSNVSETYQTHLVNLRGRLGEEELCVATVREAERHQELSNREWVNSAQFEHMRFEQQAKQRLILTEQNLATQHQSDQTRMQAQYAA
jgi:hypothetical protein